MLSDTEYEEPDKHYGKSGRIKSNKQYPDGTQNVSYKCLSPRTQKK
jgi:hypothetical protein